MSVPAQNKMQISLSSIKHTENNNMFSAIVSINGKKAFLVEHKGGGYYKYTPLIPEGSNKTYADCWEIIEQAKQYAQETLQEDFDPLDMLIEDLVNRHIVKKFLSRSMKKKILFFEDGKVTEIVAIPTPVALKSAAYAYPNAIVMNSLPIEDAIDKYIEYADSMNNV